MRTQTFKREDRFIVVKRKHLTPEQSEALLDTINREGIATSECVVVESDWPEYETVWAMIEARCTGSALATPPAPVEGVTLGRWARDRLNTNPPSAEDASGLARTGGEG